jgi:hypothetical protein
MRRPHCANSQPDAEQRTLCMTPMYRIGVSGFGFSENRRRMSGANRHHPSRATSRSKSIAPGASEDGISDVLPVEACGWVGCSVRLEDMSDFLVWFHWMYSKSHANRVMDSKALNNIVFSGLIASDL